MGNAESLPNAESQGTWDVGAFVEEGKQWEGKQWGFYVLFYWLPGENILPLSGLLISVRANLSVSQDLQGKTANEFTPGWLWKGKYICKAFIQLGNVLFSLVKHFYG